MKRLLIILATAIVVLAQTGVTLPKSLPDLVGDGAVHAISGTTLLVKDATLTAPTTNAGICRTADANITIAGQGQIIVPGGTYYYGPLPPMSSGPGYQNRDLHQIFYVCASSDKLGVQYEQ